MSVSSVDKTQDVSVAGLYAGAEPAFGHWEVIKDPIDEMIDLSLNYRQSGHPGGSRSKVKAEPQPPLDLSITVGYHFPMTRNLHNSFGWWSWRWYGPRGVVRVSRRVIG